MRLIANYFMHLALLPTKSWIKRPLIVVSFAVSATFLVCYLRAFKAPNLPLLFWGDQLGFATKGARILRGELPYRDFFEFITPGTDLVYAGLFKVFGPALWIPNVVMASLAATASGMMTWLSLRLMRGVATLLPATLLVGLVLYGSFDATHHWFSTVLAMGVICALFNGTSIPEVIAAGVLTGLTASFTQTTGAALFVGTLIYLIWTIRVEKPAGFRWKSCFWFSGCVVLTFAVINGKFILAAGFHCWIEQIIVFPAKYFDAVPINNWRGTWPQFKSQTGLFKWICFPFMYFGLPLIYVEFFTTLRRQNEIWSEPVWKRLSLIAIIGLVLLVPILPALTIKRISCSAPPAMILLAWFLSRESGHVREQTRKKLFAGGLGVISVAVVMGSIAAVQLRSKNILDLPAGRVVIPDSVNYEVYRWTAQHTRPGDWYFGIPPLILPLGLRDAAPLEGLGPGDYTQPEQVAEVLRALVQRPPRLMIVLAEETYFHRGARGAYHLSSFYQYLRLHYRRSKIFANDFEVWERMGD